jgi:FimV-like protein
MRIGELGRRTGVSARMLRYYEAQGLLIPSRRPSGYREYAASDVVRVQHVRDLLAAGLSTATIAELLPCMDTGGPAVAVGDCPELLVELRHERDRLTASIGDLERARRALDEVIATASAQTTREADELLEAGRLGDGVRC